MPSTTAMPFGLTRALPVTPPAARDWPGALAYSPQQQLTVVEDTGVPFIDTPSMATSIQTVTQTREDSQIFDDNQGTDND
ncbi:putative ATP-grasp-modified RiPP [Streptomyces sp. NPDC006992]|uniref:putative ATP-grasp-modified RiPP n=1 Tax=Streptomyces TaxID=1883 RepID=UPI00340B51DF